MPYRIERYKSGWRVYSESGTPLSNKPLSLAQATRQKTAVTLETLRRRDKFNLRGGSTVLGDVSYALTDTDIQKLLGGTSLFKYPDLHQMSSIDEAFDDKGRAMMLYLTEDEHTGHWVCMLKKGKEVEYFDSYGGYKPDDERKWLSKAKQEELGQDEPTLTRMLREAGYKVTHNPYKFQEEVNDMNTCGRHSVVRLLLGHLPLKEYAHVLKSADVTPDEFVTAFTAQLLHK